MSVVYLKIFNVLGAVMAGSPSEPLAREEAEVEGVAPSGRLAGGVGAFGGIDQQFPRGACLLLPGVETTHIYILLKNS